MRLRATIAMAGAVLGLLVLVLGLWWAGRPSAAVNGPEFAPGSGTATVSADISQIDATGLTRVYGANAADADRTFKGKLLQVRGLISKKDKAKGSETCLTMDGSVPPIRVQCLFGPEQKDALERIVPGQLRYVTVRGRCNGKRGNDIVLLDCSIP